MSLLESIFSSFNMVTRCTLNLAMYTQYNTAQIFSHLHWKELSFQLRRLVFS